MVNIPIYTIGYGKRPIKDFIQLLHQYNIQYLVDIRSRPYSRFNPDCSQAALEKQLKQASIHYMFMGDTLGGRPDDSTCYDTDGRVEYAKVREKEFYRNGISRIQTAWEKQLYVALMCSEMKPQECHRSKLIGETLVKEGIDVAHIDEKGYKKSQQDIREILTGTSEQIPLFDEQLDTPLPDKLAFSRKKYSSSGERA